MQNKTKAVELASALTTAWLGNPHTRPGNEDVPAFFRSMFETLSALGEQDSAATDDGLPEQAIMPAVSVRKSLRDPNYIISMIDGRPYRSLSRHLSSRGMTPDQYRQRHGLKQDYPMVAPGYAAERSASAKRLGLGRKAASKVEEAPVTVAAAQPVKKGRGRKSINEAKAAAKAHLGSE